MLRPLSQWNHVVHYRPQRPRSFWSAPGIETSRFLAQTRRIAASGDENACRVDNVKFEVLVLRRKREYFPF